MEKRWKIVDKKEMENCRNDSERCKNNFTFYVSHGAISKNFI